MRFKDIINQEEIKKNLIRTVTEQRISHAQMFFGPPGSGKLALAIAYAQYLCCQNRQDDDSCGICPSCIKYQKLAHPDLHFIFPVMTTTRVVKDPVSDHYIQEWRNAIAANPYISEDQWYETIGAENKQGFISRNESNEIIRKLGLKSYESEFKIVIIWLPEKMNQSAANTLLKLLEEPPAKTIFLMISENTGQIIPTIMSRTQLIRVPSLHGKAIRDKLKGMEEVSNELIDDAVRRANGDFSKALAVIEKNEQELQNFEFFTAFMRLCFQRKIFEITDLIEQFASLGRERQKQFLSYSIRMLRENFMLNLDKAELTYVTQQESEFSKKFSPFIHSGNVFDLVESFNLASSHIEANGNPRIIFLDLAIQVIKLLKRKSDAA